VPCNAGSGCSVSDSKVGTWANQSRSAKPTSTPTTLISTAATVMAAVRLGERR
jgi:hypothetical protein